MMDSTIDVISRSTQSISDGIGHFADGIEGRVGRRQVCGVVITRRIILIAIGVVATLVVIMGVSLGTTLAKDLVGYESSDSETRFWSMGLKLETSVGRSIYDANTTEHQALVWLAKHDRKNLDPVTTPLDEILQRFVVADLYFSLGGDGKTWASSYNFLSKNRECAWNDGTIGVFCDNVVDDANDYVVTQIIMPSSNLVGSLPKSITLLSNLRKIDMTDNFISSTLPDSMGTLTNLIELHFGKNQLGGTIPNSMTMLKNLTHCDLAYNNFTGESHASVFENLPRLVALNLTNNQLYGPVGKLGQISTIQYLGLAGNQFNALPDDFGPAPKLTEFHLQHNKIRGTLPSDFFWEMTDLTLLDASDNALSGELPSSLGQIASKLSTLKLSTNGFKGGMPDTIGRLVSAETIEIDDNFLDGTLTTAIGRLETLKRLNLSKNKMVGKIPTEISKMSSIEELYLNNNLLSGTVPAEMSNLFMLHTLDISSTNLFANMDEALCSSRPADFGVPLSSLKADCLKTDVIVSCATECCDGKEYCCDMTIDAECELTNNDR